MNLVKSRNAVCQEVGNVQHQRWISGNVHYIRLHKKVNKVVPLWLWNPEETSPEIQNRGTSDQKKDMCPPNKNF